MIDFNAPTLKPGFFPHHTEDCDIELRAERVTMKECIRSYWCNTHCQWCYERPVHLVYTWADGTSSSPTVEPDVWARLELQEMLEVLRNIPNHLR